MPRNAFIIETVLSIIKKLNTSPKRQIEKHPWSIHFLPSRTNILHQPNNQIFSCPF